MNKKIRKKVSFLISLLLVTNTMLCSCSNEVSNNNDIKLYDEATTLVSNYYDDLELDNSLQCFYVYDYLEYNGYLSSKNNKDYKYKDSYQNNTFGIDVLYTPDTTCRHLSEFYMNTLNKNGYEAYCMVGMLNNDDKINHQLVVVSDDYTTYQDCYNRTVFEKDNNKLIDLFEDNYMIPYFKPVTNKKLISTHNTKSIQHEINKIYGNDVDEVTKEYVAKQYDIAYHKMMVVYPEKLSEFKDEYDEKVLSKIK